MPPGDIAPLVMTIVLFFAASVGFVALGPVGRALADRLRGRSAHTPLPPGDAAQLDEMHDLLASIDRRLADLEERQDFADRMLAQVRDKGLIGPGTER
jgi:hypothetical protein